MIRRYNLILQDDQEGRLRRELLSLGVEPDSQDTISGEFQARDFVGIPQLIERWIFIYRLTNGTV